jgi:hypothetical protein
MAFFAHALNSTVAMRAIRSIRLIKRMTTVTVGLAYLPDSFTSPTHLVSNTRTFATSSRAILAED